MTDSNLLGRTIGRFEVLDVLGRGGMAVVYKARQSSPNRIVALKVLPPELSYDAGYITRFRQEADSAAALEHPHIVPIYAVDEDQGFHYIAMKYVQGRTLKDVVQQEGALSVERAAGLLSQVGEAVDYAHSQGMIHRDIKPSNIMVTPEGWVYLTDFGLARGTSGAAGLTMAGTVMGTPEYMSPEQAQGASMIGPATDMYALGIVLYELLTGHFPFQADTPQAMLVARLMQSPRPPRDYRGELPLAVEDVVMRALARNPVSRYGSAREMTEELRVAAGLVDRPSITRLMTPVAGVSLDPFVERAANLTTRLVAEGATIRPSLLQPLNATPATSVDSTIPTPIAPHMSVPRRGLSKGILIGVAAVMLVLVLSCAGKVALGTSIGKQPSADPAFAKLIDQGDQALEQAKFDAAEADYQQVLAKQSNNVTALTQVALLNDLRGRSAVVVKRARATLAVAPTSDKQQAVAKALLADGLIGTSKYADAITEAQAAAQLDETLGLALAVQGNALARQASERADASQIDAAIQALEHARAQIADDPTLLQALAYSIIGDGYLSVYDVKSDTHALDTAADAYNEALKVSEQPLFQTGLGYVATRREQYSDARAAFGKAQIIDASFEPAQLGLGWVDFRDPDVKTYDDASAAFDKAVTLDSSDAWAVFAKGRALFALKKYDEAIPVFRKANDLQEDALLLSWLGRAIQRKGYNSDSDATSRQLYKEAEQQFRRALEINNRETMALTYLGWNLQYQEQYKESEEPFRAALAIDDDQDEAHNGLGWTLYNLDQFDQAEQEFRRASALDPTYDNAFYGLGQTLEKLGKLDDAKQAYRDALKADPEDQDAQDALDKLK